MSVRPTINQGKEAYNNVARRANIQDPLAPLTPLERYITRAVSYETSEKIINTHNKAIYAARLWIDGKQSSDQMENFNYSNDEKRKLSVVKTVITQGLEDKATLETLKTVAGIAGFILFGVGVVTFSAGFAGFVYYTLLADLAWGSVAKVLISKAAYSLFAGLVTPLITLPLSAIVLEELHSNRHLKYGSYTQDFTNILGGTYEVSEKSLAEVALANEPDYIDFINLIHGETTFNFDKKLATNSEFFNIYKKYRNDTRRDLNLDNAPSIHPQVPIGLNNANQEQPGAA